VAKKKAAPEKVPFKAPFFRSGGPTPCDVLSICDQCGDAHWDYDRVGKVRHCGRCKVRMRKGTEEERTQARKALKLDFGKPKETT
jgi:hypothetical protein